MRRKLRKKLTINVAVVRNALGFASLSLLVDSDEHGEFLVGVASHKPFHMLQHLQFRVSLGVYAKPAAVLS